MRANPDVVAVEPILSVPDVAAAVAWYGRVLGATGGWQWRNAPGEPVSHGGCRFGRAAVQLSLDDAPAGGAALFFRCGFGSADALDAYADAVRRAAGGLRQEPSDRPWGLREFHLLDPQGRLLRFAGPTTRPKNKRGPAGFSVEDRRPTGAEWVEIITAVGWADSSPLERAAEVVGGATYGATAVADGRAVGCLLLMSNRVNQAYFSDVAVRPAWQGRGVGSAMVRAALAWCGANLEPSAVLALSTGRATAAFYERFGFAGGDEGGGYGMSRRLRQP